MTMYPTIAIVMPKEMIEKPIENVFSHEEFVLSITLIILVLMGIFQGDTVLFSWYHYSCNG